MVYNGYLKYQKNNSPVSIHSTIGLCFEVGRGQREHPAVPSVPVLILTRGAGTEVVLDGPMRHMHLVRNAAWTHHMVPFCLFCSVKLGKLRYFSIWLVINIQLFVFEVINFHTLSSWKVVQQSDKWDSYTLLLIWTTVANNPNIKVIHTYLLFPFWVLFSRVLDLIFNECSPCVKVIDIFFYHILLTHFLLNILHPCLLWSTSGFCPRCVHLHNLSQYSITQPSHCVSIPS